MYSHINIDEQDVYTYYRKDNNGYVKENITLENDMDSLIIYEDNNVTPSVKEYTKEFTTGWGNTWDYLILGTKMTTKHYEVYVPIGSVVQEYKLDAQ